MTNKVDKFLKGWNNNKEQKLNNSITSIKIRQQSTNNNSEPH